MMTVGFSDTVIELKCYLKRVSLLHGYHRSHGPSPSCITSERPALPRDGVITQNLHIPPIALLLLQKMGRCYFCILILMLERCQSNPYVKYK